jgi:hypothetical protein
VIALGIDISYPYSDRWANVYAIGGALTENKSWEFQLMKTNTIVQLNINVTSAQDHAGLKVEVGFLGYTAEFNLHDNRHWDYENKHWQVYKD